MTNDPLQPALDGFQQRLAAAAKAIPDGDGAVAARDILVGAGIVASLWESGGERTQQLITMIVAAAIRRNSFLTLGKGAADLTAADNVDKVMLLLCEQFEKDMRQAVKVVEGQSDIAADIIAKIARLQREANGGA